MNFKVRISTNISKISEIIIHKVQAYLSKVKSNIYDWTFSKKELTAIIVYYFRKITSSDRVLYTPLMSTLRFYWINVPLWDYSFNPFVPGVH